MKQESLVSRNVFVSKELKCEFSSLLFQRKVNSYEYSLSPGLDWILLRHDEKTEHFSTVARYTLQEITSRYSQENLMFHKILSVEGALLHYLDLVLMICLFGHHKNISSMQVGYLVALTV